MKASKISGIATAVLALVTVVCANQEGPQFESAATACACFAIAAICLFFIYRDHESLIEIDQQADPFDDRVWGDWND